MNMPVNAKMPRSTLDEGPKKKVGNLDITLSWLPTDVLVAPLTYRCNGRIENMEIYNYIYWYILYISI